MGKGDAKFFNAELKKIKDCKDYEEVCFLKYPEEIKKHIYTTNGVESLNSLLKKIRARLGGYFQSIAILEINILLQIENLKENTMKRHKIIENSRDIKGISFIKL